LRYASIVVSERFTASLDAVLDFVTARSATKADALAVEVLRRIRSLDENARRGRMIPELMDDAMRELIVGDYRLLYRVDEGRGAVEVLLLWPARKPLGLGSLLDGE